MKALLFIAALLLALYVLAAIALYTLQRKFIFHPTPLFDHPHLEQTLELPDAPGQNLRLIVLNPGHERALIYFGGNAESVAGSAAELAQQFNEHTVYLVNYRGYGGSDGSPSEAALFADATAVFDHVAGTHQRVSAMGRSLGSGVVCWLATQRELAAVVLVTPFDSIVRIAQNLYPIFPVRWLLKDHFPSADFAPDIKMPVLVMIAADDRVIPLQSTQRLIDAFNQPVKQVMLEATGHNDIQQHEKYYAAIQEFLQ